MKTFETIPIRVFPVRIRDKRSGKEIEDTIILTKSILAAAQLVGESSREVINRAYDRRGYRVLEIDKPQKMTVTVDLEEAASGVLSQAGKTDKNDSDKMITL